VENTRLCHRLIAPTAGDDVVRFQLAPERVGDELFLSIAGGRVFPVQCVTVTARCTCGNASDGQNLNVWLHYSELSVTTLFM